MATLPPALPVTVSRLSLEAPAYNPLAASLQRRRMNWHRLQGSSPDHLACVSSWIEHGFPVPFTTLPPPFLHRSPPVTDPDSRQWLLESELPRLLRLGAIARINPSQVTHSSPAFIVTRRHSGRKRLVNDLRLINRYVAIPKVRFESLRNVANLIRSSDHFISFDISDAYLHLPVHPDNRRHLAFNIEGMHFEVNSLPFGLAASPSAWHTTMLCVINHLRTQFNLRIVWLLDDVLVLCDSLEHGHYAASVIRPLLASLGLRWNDTKCHWSPVQHITFLGLDIDTSGSTPQFSVPDTTIADIRQFASSVHALALRNNNRVPMRTLGSLAGKVMSISLAFSSARLLTREFYFVMHGFTPSARRHSRLSWNRWVSLTPQALLDLEQLESLPALVSRRTHLPSMLRAVRLFSDASSTGWGATLNGQTVSGPFLGDFVRLPITLKETAAAVMAVEHFTTQLSDCRLMLLVDNAATCAILNSGTCRNPRIMELVRHFYRHCAQHNITFRARWISTHFNPADKPSRQYDRHAWSLSNHALQRITQHFGQLSIDLFASHDNRLLDRFCSFDPHPHAYAHDAFTLDWSRLPRLPIAVPPFSAVHRVLRHTIECRARVLLVAPYWPTRPWWSTLLQLAASPLLTLPRGACLPAPLARRRLLPEIWSHWGIRLVALVIDGSLLNSRHSLRH